MNHKLLQLFISLAVLFSASVVNAADGYRFLHVTIETPWAIFIFLLLFILTPFVLMAVLYWYFAYKKNKEERLQSVESQKSSVE